MGNGDRSELAYRANPAYQADQPDQPDRVTGQSLRLELGP